MQWLARVCVQRPVLASVLMLVILVLGTVGYRGLGVDRPSALMDADAADPSIFGPRRLSIDDCERAVRQSGPGVAIPLLEPWPMTSNKARTGPSAP